MKEIRIHNLHFSYGEQLIFKDFSYVFEGNKIYGITGPSGRGKTSLLRLIAGLEAPLKGEIYADGELYSEENRILVPPYRRKMGFIFQDLALWPHMKLRRQLAFVCKELRIESWQNKVDEIMDLFGMKAYEHKYPHELSGGQKQMLAIARALVTEPELLLIDEPFTNLDHKLKQKVIAHLLQLQKEKKFGVLWVTHDRGDIRLVDEELKL